MDQGKISLGGFLLQQKKPSQMDEAKIGCAAALPNKQTSSVPIANIDVHCNHYHDNFKC